jgi:ABC-type polar amino acid transport system ATPase subunit
VVNSIVGIVLQSFNLFPHMSVLDNISLAPRKVHGVPRSTAGSRAREMLEQSALTMIVATHEMGFARQVADELVFPANGYAVESGPPERALDAPEDDRMQRFLRRVNRRR